MDAQEFKELLAPGYERRGVEFKGPGPRSNRQLFAKVVRAVLGMANRRDGGLVVIGVQDNGGVLDPVGLDAAALRTWRYDDVAAALATYAVPSVDFDLETSEHQGKRYVLLRVREFEDIPVLCKKDYEGVLRDGACYVRSRRKPETAEIPSEADMRDLLELATEKRLRRFLAQARAARLDLSAGALPTDQDLFDKQLGDLK